MLTAPLSKGTILLADDDALVCETLDHLFTDAGYVVRVASDGEAAIAAALSQRPDFILCDIKLPKKNGFEVIREIEEKVAPHRIPFFLFSGLALEDVRLASIRIGAEDFIAKPFDGAALLARVAQRLQAGPSQSRKVHVIDLQPIIDVLGADWARLRPRALAIAESVIAREITKGEGYVCDGHRRFYLVLPDVDVRIVRQRIMHLNATITDRLIGCERRIRAAAWVGRDLAASWSAAG